MGLLDVEIRHPAGVARIWVSQHRVNNQLCSREKHNDVIEMMRFVACPYKNLIVLDAIGESLLQKRSNERLEVVITLYRQRPKEMLCNLF